MVITIKSILTSKMKKKNILIIFIVGLPDEFQLTNNSVDNENSLSGKNVMVENSDFYIYVNILINMNNLNLLCK